jgi:hypothetical protein
MSTCDAFFNESNFSNQSVFERYIVEKDRQILCNRLATIDPPHVTGAFIITGMPGYPKGEGVIRYFHIWCDLIPWKMLWEQWLDSPPLLADMYDMINAPGLGSFMRGQLIADLKYLPFMLNAIDWWTWATPGPGSMRGLNIVFGRPMNTAWRKGEWLEELQRLRSWVKPELEKIGIGRLHNQDLQNCLCEFSKYTKVMTDAGRPRQRFQHA